MLVTAEQREVLDYLWLPPPSAHNGLKQEKTHFENESTGLAIQSHFLQCLVVSYYQNVHICGRLSWTNFLNRTWATECSLCIRESEPRCCLIAESVDRDYSLSRSWEGFLWTLIPMFRTLHIPNLSGTPFPSLYHHNSCLNEIYF